MEVAAMCEDCRRISSFFVRIVRTVFKVAAVARTVVETVYLVVCPYKKHMQTLALVELLPIIVEESAHKVDAVGGPNAWEALPERR